MTITTNIAKELSRSGLCIVPTVSNEKRPDSFWTNYQKQFPTESKLDKWFDEKENRDGLGCICGKISGNLEVLDFDDKGSAFAEWKRNVTDAYVDIDSLPIERTPSGGYHVFYRCSEIAGGKKLAWTADHCSLIETRGEGNFIKCSPSDGYSMIQGDLSQIPEVTPEVRKAMLDNAYLLNKYVKTEPKTPERYTEKKAPTNGDIRPGDDFNVRGDEIIRQVLQEFGWKYLHTTSDGNEHFERPGKNEHKTSATLRFVPEKGKWYFYNFSSSVEKLDENAEYSIFDVYSRYKFDGNYTDSASYLATIGYGSDKYKSVKTIQNEIDLEALAKNANSSNDEKKKKAIEEIRKCIYSDVEEESGTNKRSGDSFIEFPMEMLPREVREYIEIQALLLNQRPSALALVMLSFLGGLIGGSAMIYPVPSWGIYPVIWTGFIGISGMGKSPVIKRTTDLILDKEEQFQKEYVQRCSQWAAEQKEFERLKRKGEAVLAPIKPACRKISVTEATFEGLVKDIRASNYRLIMTFDELSVLFAIMNRNGTPGEAARWLSLHDGSPVNTSRATSQEVWCKRGLVTIYGGTTPEKFKEFIKAKGGDKDGTLSRFCLVWSPFKSQCYIPTHEEHERGERKKEELKRIVEAIVDYTPPDGDLQKIIFPPELEIEWNSWYKTNWDGTTQATNDNESSLHSKSRQLPASVALILHFLKSAIRHVSAVDWNGYYKSDEAIVMGCDTSQDGSTLTPNSMIVPDVIDEETWKEAKEISDWIIDENWKVNRKLQFISSGIDKLQTNRIFNIIKESGDKGASLRDIGQRICGYRSAKGKKELVTVLDLMIQAGGVKKVGISTGNNKITERYFAVDNPEI